MKQAQIDELRRLLHKHNLMGRPLLGSGFADAAARALPDLLAERDRLREALDLIDACLRYPSEPWPVEASKRIAGLSKLARAALEDK